MLKSVLDLNVGDEFVAEVGWDGPSLRRVVRKTATQVIDAQGVRWNKRNRIVGDTYAYSRSRAHVPESPKEWQRWRDKIDDTQLKPWVRRTQFTLPQLRAMKAACDALDTPDPETPA